MTWRPCSGNIAVINVAGHCLPGTQNVSVYTFFRSAMSTDEGFSRKRRNWGPSMTDNDDGIPQTNEWDKENNYTGVPRRMAFPTRISNHRTWMTFRTRCSPRSASILRKSCGWFVGLGAGHFHDR